MSRKDTRVAITNLMETISEFVKVYDHETKDFAGLSPVAMVHSDGSQPLTTRGNTDPMYGYYISIWWRRDDGGDTEDRMDDVSDRVIQIVKADRSANLSRLRPVNEMSQMDYPIVDNVQYRRERIKVQA